jgi:hypothetical protein
MIISFKQLDVRQNGRNRFLAGQSDFPPGVK